MKRQRADYRFVTFTENKDQYWGYGFFESEMEDIYDDRNESVKGGSEHGTVKGRKVELALAPALERCGNANGRLFDQTFILIKADVSCKKLKKKGSQSNSKGTGQSTQGLKNLGRTWNKYANRAKR